MLEMLSVLVNLLGNAECLVGSVRGHYKPQRITWLIWSLILGVASVSYWASGARESLWFLVAEFVMTAVITLVALRRGGWGDFTKLDMMMLACAAAGLCGWAMSGQPFVALVCILVADVCGAIPAIRSSLRSPYHESPYAYAAGALSALMGVYLVGQWSVSLVVYPLYLFVMNGIVYMTIAVGRYHTAAKPGQQNLHVFGRTFDVVAAACLYRLRTTVVVARTVIRSVQLKTANVVTW